MSETDLGQVSAEDSNGRVLTGVGTTTEALQETMDRHEPDASPAKPDAPEATPAAPAATPKPPRGQQRISALTSERDKAEYARQTAERERDELKQRIEAMSRPAPQEPVRQPTQQPVQTATRPKPTEAEVGTKYEAYADFIEDLADWKAEQRFNQHDLGARIRETLEADRANRAVSEQREQVFARGKAAYPDFEQVLRAPHGQAENWPALKTQAIIDSGAPEHIQYRLLKDPVLAERLRVEPNMFQFVTEIQRLIPASAVASPASTAGAGSVIVPSPYQPVGSGSKATVTPSADLPKRGYDFDQSGYREKRAAERGVTRRR